jgi:hypothetical protein
MGSALTALSESGRHYNLYLRIDGLEPILWQYSSRGEPSGWSRSIKTCLAVGSEVSQDLDLGEMWCGLSAMTFELAEHEDTDGNSYFAKLFAPSRYLTSDERCLLAKGADYGQYVDADEAAIPVEGGGNLTAEKTYHLGQENLYVESVTATELAASRGRYPCIGSGNWAQTYPRPVDTEEGYQQLIAEYPYSWIGRRVALYLTAWDETNNAWYGESESERLWVGRIADRIVCRAATRRWVLSCTSIIQELESKKLCVDMPSTSLDRINLMGSFGRAFKVHTDLVDDADNKKKFVVEVTVPQSIYTRAELVKATNDAIASAYKAAGKEWCAPVLYGVGAKGEFRWAGLLGYSGQLVVDARSGKYPCHALRALGFDIDGTLTTTKGTSDQTATLAGSEGYAAYHPLTTNCNGGSLYVDNPKRLWADQGDNDTAAAVVMIAGANFAPQLEGFRGRYIARYTSRDTVSLALDHCYNDDVPGQAIFDGAYVGQRESDPPTDVQQVYVPRYQTSEGQRRGPFELLLYSLLSTGTSGYNDATYDKLPLALSVGVQASLVDKQSFVNADHDIMQSDLAHRRAYLIDKPVTWQELCVRESKLFGYALVWRAGLLSLEDVTTPAYERASTTIDESVRARDDWPDSDAAIDTVINQYECEIALDPTTGQHTGPKITISDVNSITGLQAIKAVRLEHPGILWSSSAPAKDLLSRFLMSRWLAIPSPVVHVSLNHTTIAKVFPGAVVKFRSTRTPDPRGDGTYETYCLATVLSSGRDYGVRGYPGTAALILHGDMPTAADSGLGGMVWATGAVTSALGGAAAVAAGNNWDDGTKKLTLVEAAYGNSDTDPDDGARLYDGYEVLITEAAPSDPESPQQWGPFALNGDYDTAGKTITLEAGASLAGYDTEKEYVVTFADHADVEAASSTQVESGTWQGDPTTGVASGTTLSKYAS